MSNNKNMHKAKTEKNDEFYTRMEDIEKELKNYKDYFKGKTVLCNCDDPFESYFFKFFALRFKKWELKELITTSYYDSAIKKQDINMFDNGAYKVRIVGESDDEDNIPDFLKKEPYNLKDVMKWLKDQKKSFPNGNLNAFAPLETGDFASPECVKLLDEADIVVTNPPFSKFREFVALLMEHKKQFLIIGNMNAITYKEIFPLIKENKLWLGYESPKEFVQPDGTTKKFGNICWFTNLPTEKREEYLDLFEGYSPDKYPMYDNYLAINVDRVSDIPCNEWFIMTVGEDHYNKLKATYGDDCVLIDSDDVNKQYHIKVRNIVMGVPITFLYKYNPKQFEIVSFRKGDNGEDLIFTRARENEFNRTFESLYDIDSRSDQEQGMIAKWEAYIRENNNKKGLAGTFIDEPVDCFHVLLTNGVNKLKVDTKNIFKRLLIRHKKQNKP